MIPRVAFIFTHRIQYFTNLMDELQRRGKYEVAAFYAHETSRISDTGFNRQIEWDNRKQTGYREILLPDSARRAHGPFLSSFSKELAAQLNKFDPDVVHLNGYNTAIQWQAWIWAIRHHIPILARGDGDMLGSPQRFPLSPQKLLARLFTHRLNHVFYQGAENEQFWLARGADKIRMSWVPCVSDSQVFRKKAFACPAERDAFRAANNARANDVVFVVSGKLEKRKHPADAIEALALCTAENARLWFLGSGPLEGELQALAKKRQVDRKITWFGFRNQNELPAVLQAADVLLHPSEMDPWPYSILDGGISGLAMVLSDKVGSHPDWISKGQAGRIFQAGNQEELARLMHLFATDATLLAACQQAAIQHASIYTETEFCRRLEATVDDVLYGARQ
jgi:glycosyltransferase involved in cell wall biosynthesis